jgi:hypothetical protein
MWISASGGRWLRVWAAAMVLTALLPGAARATCMEDEVQSCSKGSCKGWNRCIDGVWTGCVYTGESTDGCSVCGRRGYRYCSDTGNVEPTSCSAFGAERCNACDDNGNGSVDEGLNGTACAMANGCTGVTLCTATGPTCVWTQTSHRECSACGSGGSEVCRQDGSIGPCQPSVASVSELPCNDCDDNKDGVGDGTPSNPEVCNGLDDNCDGRLDEGATGIEGDACRVDVQAICACQPTTCAAQGKNCGSIPNGCGGTLNCGTCAAGQTCSSTNVCVCQPTTCAAQGKNCGTISNGCGGTLNCGTCSGYNTCGGGGTSNICGCTPIPNWEACDGRECGSVANGCGGLINCGSCPGGTTCKAGTCSGTISKTRLEKDGDTSTQQLLP